VKVYVTSDLTRMFQVRPRTLRRWIADRRFPRPIMPGRWDAESVEAWYRDRCVKSAQGQIGTNADTHPTT
jgi:predicted DNA-binding transcriptional regulator AlpA